MDIAADLYTSTSSLKEGSDIHSLGVYLSLTASLDQRALLYFCWVMRGFILSQENVCGDKELKMNSDICSLIIKHNKHKHIEILLHLFSN